MSDDLTPREKLFRAADPADDTVFAAALDKYRDSLRAAWQAGELEPVYCPYDCDHCHDNDTCVCPNCQRIRDEDCDE